MDHRSVEILIETVTNLLKARADARAFSFVILFKSRMDFLRLGLRSEDASP